MPQVIIACAKFSATEEVPLVARMLARAWLNRHNARQCFLPGRGRRKIGELTRRNNEVSVETLTRVRRNHTQALVSRLLRSLEALE